MTSADCLSAETNRQKRLEQLSQSSNASSADNEAFAGICGPTGAVDGLCLLTDILTS